MPGNGHRPGKINTTGVKIPRDDSLPRDITPPPAVAAAKAAAPAEAAAAHAASSAPLLTGPPAPGGSESIRVVVRVRPLNKKELANGEDEATVTQRLILRYSLRTPHTLKIN
jgi:hypothetical protein